jgi:superfamily I DNA and/or RNA helicase
VTHSNGAADVLLEALLQVGVPAVRIGRPASVSPHVQHRTAAALAESHPAVVALRRTASNMKLQPYERGVAARQMPQCLMEVQKLIIDTAPVVVASCIGAHQLLIDDGEAVQFSTVVLDEAAQTTEPALICALAAARAQQVVLIGDTHQLPPTITSVHLRDTLGVSPMARLEGLGLPVKTLEVQYRLPTILLEHPSKYFYNGLIKSAETVYEGPPPKGFAWPKNDQPLAFVHVGSNLERSHDFGGKSNPTEAKIVVDIAMGILASGDIAAKHMAIISPYAKQVQLLRSMLSARRAAEEKDDNDVRVGTVDSFQGQETDVVIFSSVRSNTMFELGFLRDRRRLCVAITRARRGLILVGDRPVLQACHHWAALITHCSSHGCLMNATSLAAAAVSPVLSSIRRKPPIGPTSVLLQTGNFTFTDILADLMGNDAEDSDLGLFEEDEDDPTDLSW